MTTVLKFNEDYNQDRKEELVSLVTLASNLGFQPKKKVDIRKEDFTPTTWIPLEKLVISEDYQRLLIQAFIRKAGKFDPTLFTHVIVSRRPDGTLMVVDGQHESIIGCLYTNQGGKLEVPCQVTDQPASFTTEQCKVVESEQFQKRQGSRNNLTAVDNFRAGIAGGVSKYLKQEETLYDLGVCIENIGDMNGHSVYGYSKLFEAVEKYKLPSCMKAINQYDKNRTDKRFAKWSEEKDMRGALILGMAAVYDFMKEELGQGDKCYALKTFMENNLGMMKIDGDDHLLKNSAGPLQRVIIARRIIANCNNLIEQGYIVKKSGEKLKHIIGEASLEAAGLSDPTKNPTT